MSSAFSLGSLAQFQLPSLTPCENALVSLLQNKLPSSAAIINAIGKTPNDLGNLDDCRSIPDARYCLLQSKVAYQGMEVPVKMGWCGPSICNGKDLDDVFEKLLQKNISDYFYGMSVQLNIEVVFGGLYKLELGSFPVTTPPGLPKIRAFCTPQNNPTSQFYVVVITISILMIITFIATILDWYYHNPDENETINQRNTTIQGSEKLLKPKLKIKQTSEDEEDMDDSNVALRESHFFREKAMKEENRENEESQENEESVNNEILELDSSEDEEEEKLSVKYVGWFDRENFSIKLLLCFSILRNYKFLVSEDRHQETAFLNGIRVLSIFWIILGHTHFFLLFSPMFGLLGFLSNTWKSFSFQFISGAHLAVDSFYFLSGFLVTMAILRVLQTQTEKHKSIGWGIVYFHRWWRLTPLYFLVIWIWTYVTPVLVNGPLAYGGDDLLFASNTCVDYWWSNILYINNFFPWKQNLEKSCLPWGWYLSNDMQFFIISPLLLSFYYKYKKQGIALIALLTVSSLVAVATLFEIRDISLGNEDYSSLYYTKPWSRFPSYVIGMALYLVWDHRKSMGAEKFSAFIRFIGCGVAILFMATTIYGTYTFVNDGWGKAENTSFWTLCRCGFVLGLAILSLFMLNDQIYPIKRFLSLPMWTPLAKLTFGAYLLHPVIQFVVYRSTRHALDWNMWTISLYFSGYLLLSFASSFVFWLICEKPTSNLEREVIMKVTGRKELM